MSTVARLCCFCQHFSCWHEEGYSYSEWTWAPGSFTLSCDKACFRMDGGFSTEDFRQCIRAAEQCPEFYPVTVGELKL